MPKKKTQPPVEQPEGLLVNVFDVEVLDLSHPDNAHIQAAIDARGEAKKAIRKQSKQ